MKKITLVTAFTIYLASFQLHAAPIEVLNDGGFETSVSDTSSDDISSWTVGEIGSWAIADPYTITGSDAGISPLGGTKMMKLDPPASGHASHDIYQIVDVSAYASFIDAGLVTADLSAFFNSTGSTNVALTLHGANTAPTDFSDFQSLSGVTSYFTIDDAANTWEQVNVNNVLLSSDIRYLFFGIHEPTTSPIAYVDDASLTLTIASVPEPSSFVLLGLGLAGIILNRRKRV